ncbi:hypothetical protein D3C75_1228150 [compost metagenome]
MPAILFELVNRRRRLAAVILKITENQFGYFLRVARLNEEEQVAASLPYYRSSLVTARMVVEKLALIGDCTAVQC